MKSLSPLALSVSLSALLVGCGSPEEEVGNGPTPEASIKFEGEVQAALVGEWKTADGRSSLSLSKDGQARVGTVGPPNAGAKSVEDKGLWLAGDGTLLLSVNKTGASPQVLRYFVTRKGENAMELRGRQGSTIVTTYQRKR